MKIEYSAEDNEYMNTTNPVPIACPEMNHKYALVFEVTDIAKANNFILTLLGSSSLSERISNDIGISADKLIFDANTLTTCEKDRLKEQLLNIISAL